MYECKCSIPYYDLDGKYQEKECGKPCVPPGGMEFALGLSETPLNGLRGNVCGMCDQWVGCSCPDCLVVNLDGVEYFIQDDRQLYELPDGWRATHRIEHIPGTVDGMLVLGGEHKLSLLPQV